MKFTDAKQDTDVALKGIKAEIDWHDTTAKAITFTDADGRIVRIAKGEYGSLDILIPAPPKFVEVWRLAGRIPGIQEAVLEYHDLEVGARKRLQVLRQALRVAVDLTIEKVRVTEEEAFAHKPPTIEAALEEVPF